MLWERSSPKAWTGLATADWNVFFFLLLLLLRIELERDHPLPEPEGLRVVAGENGVEVLVAGTGAEPSHPEDRMRRAGPRSTLALSSTILRAEGQNKGVSHHFFWVCVCVSVRGPVL